MNILALSVFIYTLTFTFTVKYISAGKKKQSERFSTLVILIAGFKKLLESRYIPAISTTDTPLSLTLVQSIQRLAENLFSSTFPWQQLSVQGHQTAQVSVYICSVEGNSTGIFVSKVSPGIFVI